MKIVAPLLGASLMATGCQTKSQTGAAVGAGGGGLLGAAVGGTSGALVGAAIGGLFGYGVGRAIEEEDQRRVAYALEENQPVSWVNPDTGYRYEVVPQNTVVRAGRECREFRMMARVDGDFEEVNGFACRRPDGSWELMDTGG